MSLILVLALAAGLRLRAPSRWPIFLDEDQHAAAALLISRHPSVTAGLATAALATGKPPIFPALIRLLTPRIGDGVRTGRLVSGIAGLATTLFCFLLGAHLGSPWLGIGVALVYATSPWAVLHERLAAHDGLLTALTLAALLLVWRALSRGAWSDAMVAALVGAAAVGVKQSGVVLAVLPVLAWWALRPSRAGDGPRAMVMGASPVVMLAILSSGPFARVNGAQSTLWAPFGNVSANLRTLLEIVAAYMPMGLGALVLAGVIAGLWSGRGFARYLALALVTWTLPWPLVGNFAPSRYYLPALPLACALAVFGIRCLAERCPAGSRALRLAGGLWLVTTAALSARTSVAMVADLGAASLPGIDAFQYQGDWPSGFGVAEARDHVFARAEASARILPVMHPGHAIAVGAINPPRRNVTMLPFQDPWKDVEVASHPRDAPLYIVVDDLAGGVRSRQIMGSDPHITLERVFPRPGGRTAVFVLRRPAMSANDRARGLPFGIRRSRAGA